MFAKLHVKFFIYYFITANFSRKQFNTFVQ